MPSFLDKLQTSHTFEPPNHWFKIKTIDMHTGGEPLRVIIDGFPVLEGSSVLEYRNFIKNNYDHLRLALMHEPRGHADMYGCILLPPNDKEADFGILFLHNEGYSTMCGHAIIAISNLAIKMKWVEVTSPETHIKIDAPCGRINSFVKIKNGKVESVYFHCGVTLAKQSSNGTITKITEMSTTEVIFRQLSDTEINTYLEKEQPYDCAGSFKSEGLGISLFDQIKSNDPTCLIGLPLILVRKMLCNQAITI